jgi:hypothetical protein
MTWHRLCCRHDFVFHFKLWIVSCGVWFVISFCMVLEFRNDGNLPTRNFFFLPQMKESSLHVYAALNTMLSFSALHVLLAISLFKCSAHARLEPDEAAPMGRRRPWLWPGWPVDMSAASRRTPVAGMNAASEATVLQPPRPDRP